MYGGGFGATIVTNTCGRITYSPVAEKTKTLTGLFLVTACLFVVVLLASCATLTQPPDPAKVQAQIAESRAQEIELVRATVADPVRAERFVELLRKRDRLVEEHAGRLIAYRKKVAALTADYDARREEFDSLLADFNRQRESAQQETIDLVAAMKGATTADEWKTISRFQLKQLDPRKLVYGTVARGG